MERLFEVMAEDMGITPYKGESEDSYIYRIVFSALGLWCLTNARTEMQDIKGISKNAQTILLHNLAEEYIKFHPSLRCFFVREKKDLAVFIRNLYEQSGYLMISDNNYNILNKGAEAVRVSDIEYLYLGLPSGKISVNGLGIHCCYSDREISIQEFLIRDSLTPEEYIAVNYNLCDFETRDIDCLELEFLDTKSLKPVSKSWRREHLSEFTIARKGYLGPYYKVIVKNNGKIFFSDENKNIDSIDSLTGAEFRRLYIALRRYYNHPMEVLVCPIDNEYTHIKINGQMPNREYFYFLLNGWPKGFATDRYNFIMRNELVPQSITILENLGFKSRNGVFYG